MDDYENGQGQVAGRSKPLMLQGQCDRKKQPFSRIMGKKPISLKKIKSLNGWMALNVLLCFQIERLVAAGAWSGRAVF